MAQRSYYSSIFPDSVDGSFDFIQDGFGDFSGLPNVHAEGLECQHGLDSTGDIYIGADL